MNKKIELIPDGLYTIYWEEEYEYNSAFYVPGIASKVRGYQFTGTKQEVATHIKYYLKRKDNLVSVKVTPYEEEDLPSQWHRYNGVLHDHSRAECPDMTDEEKQEDNAYWWKQNGTGKQSEGNDQGVLEKQQQG